MSEYYEGPSYGLRDRQRDKPCLFCPVCEAELFSGDRVYLINGRPVCIECFEDWVRELLAVSPHILADRLGVDVSNV